MLKKVGFCLIAALLSLLVGCKTMKVEDFADHKPEFKIEDYFQGKTWGWGIFEDRFGNFKRSFTVNMMGTLEDGKLILDEDFIYGDGTIDKRIWKINILDNKRYSGVAEDVVGTAEGQRAGNAFNWQYTMDLTIGSRQWRVKFDDWLYLQPDGVVINRATVTKWGITLGTLTFVFNKQGPKS